MAKTKKGEFMPRQPRLKPSTLTGIKCAQIGASLGTRLGPQGIIFGGAIGFVAGAIVGGMLDEPLDII